MGPIEVISTVSREDIIHIDLGKRKRCWRNIENALYSDIRIDLDWRIVINRGELAWRLVCSCGEVLEIKHCKDFPLRSKKCKCGAYFIKWA